jgi:hypothetical protein
MTSKIKVDNIENQCGGAVVTKCGGTTTIAGTNVNATTVTATNVVGSTAVKSNAIQASDGGNLVSQSGTTITLGASGDTINLASGASQSGFGRTGTVDWQTGSIKTATFTAANGEGYFANTSGGAFTVNLPAGSAGAIVSVADYTNTFQTNALTVAPNGSEKIGGIAAPNNLNTEGQSVTFVYVDGTEGWKNIQDSTSNVTGNPNLIATGGTITTSGNCKIHTFTGPGSFVVSSISQTAPHNVVSYTVVGGGGGGSAGGGGGAGGFREVKTPDTPYTASPLDGYPTAPNRVTVTATSFPITVGGGGSDSVFSTITSARGGNGGFYGASCGSGNSGGSGGGGVGTGATGAGNTPPVSPPQGNPGGPGGGQPNFKSAGGGGAGATGGGSPSTTISGNGGNGVTTSITGSPVTRAGGGGGSSQNTAIQVSSAGLGGSGGGGGGGATGGPGPTNRPAGVAGTVNTGSGGGGGFCVSAANGGSGIVIIRYKFQ